MRWEKQRDTGQSRSTVCQTAGLSRCGGQAQKLHTQLSAKGSLHVVVTFAVCVCETPISFALFITCQLFIHDGATLIKGATRANMTKILLAYSVVKALRQGCVLGRGVGTTSAWLRLQTSRHFSVKVRKKHEWVNRCCLRNLTPLAPPTAMLQLKC